MWKDVFRNRNTSSEARDKVLSALDRTLPSEAKKKLGELSDNSPQTFCTIQDVVDSVSSVKMNKSPGIDGLPVTPKYPTSSLRVVYGSAALRKSILT